MLVGMNVPCIKGFVCSQDETQTVLTMLWVQPTQFKHRRIKTFHKENIFPVFFSKIQEELKDRTLKVDQNLSWMSGFDDDYGNEKQKTQEFGF